MMTDRANLKKRLATATVLVAVLIVVLFFLPRAATAWMLSVAVLFGAWEWSAFFLPVAKRLERLVYVAAVAVLLKLIWDFTATSFGRDLLLTVAVAWWIVALLWILLAPRHAAPWSAALAGFLALVPAWLALMRMRFDLARGAEWVLFCLILVWMADIGGYLFGHRFGRLHLAPKVSPRKTWEGALGGVALSALVAFGGSFWFKLPTWPFVLLCFAAVCFSIVGDLTESLLKRYAGLKDSGSLFPGHGGMMDRIDSVTGAAPVLLFGLMVLKVLP